jgi:hypothetical protein
MKIRFQADADLNDIIVKAVLRREPAIDFQTARTAGLSGLPDAEVLAYAAHGGRLLVTHDRRTMPEHFGRFIQSEPSAGVLIVPQKLPISQVAEELTLLWLVCEAGEWVNRIHCLPL